MRITEKEQAFRKKRMIDKAYELFCEYGIDCVSIAQIAKASGVSANSIFRYFDSKAALVQQTQTILWQEMVSQILSGNEEKLAKAENGFAEMEILLSNFKKLYENHSQFILFASDYKLFLIRNHLRITKECHDNMMKPVFDTFTAALERGQKDGSIEKGHSVIMQYNALWGVMHGFIEEAIIYDNMLERKNSWESQFELVLRYTLEALRAKS